MKQLGVLALLMVGGALAWLFAAKLSADALGLAVGLIFGMLSGLPLALLMVVAERRDRHPLTLDPWQDAEPAVRCRLPYELGPADDIGDDDWMEDDWMDAAPPAPPEVHYHVHFHGDVTPATLARFPGERPAALIATTRRDA